MLFVCNNNQYAISTPSSFSSPVENPGADRAAAYGMPSRVVDGLDVLAVYEAAKELVEGIRAGNGPAVLDCRTYRVRGHFEGDQAKYRDAAVTEEWRKKDCVEKMERYLCEQGVMTQEEAAFARIVSRGEVVKTVDLAIDQEFTVDGKNTVTVKDGKIAVTWADCPDHYCMKRGFCAGGTDIVCLPNRLVIEFLGEQSVDAAIG